MSLDFARSLATTSSSTLSAGYYIRLGSASLDSELFEERLAQARTAAPTLRIALLDGALALWSGQAFGEFADEWWARPAALRLEELRLVANEERVEALLAVGEHEQAVSDLNAFVSRTSAAGACGWSADAGDAIGRTPDRGAASVRFAS